MHTCCPRHICPCVHMCTHTHTHTCMPVMHPCTGSGRNQLCEHNKETDGAEHGHRPTGLIYREVTVTLWGAVSGAKIMRMGLRYLGKL